MSAGSVQCQNLDHDILYRFRGEMTTVFDKASVKKLPRTRYEIPLLKLEKGDRFLFCPSNKTKDLRLISALQTDSPRIIEMLGFEKNGYRFDDSDVFRGGSQSKWVYLRTSAAYAAFFKAKRVYIFNSKKQCYGRFGS